MRRFLFFCISFVLILPAHGHEEAASEAPVALEYQIKAAFLYNLANFVTWPEDAFHEREQSFTFCTVGQDFFRGVLDITLTNMQIQGRRTEVKKFHDAGQMPGLSDCRILFVSHPEQYNIAHITRQVGNASTLTVGESEHFICRGGMVLFYEKDRKIRLAINYDLMKASGLTANPNLLRLSKLVTTEDCH